MRLPPVFAALAGSLLAASILPAAPRIVARGHEGDRLRLVSENGVQRIESRSGVRPLAAPPGAAIETVERHGGGWLVAGTTSGPQGSDLFLMVGDDRSETVLPVPPGRVAKARTRPVTFSNGTELAGVAWQEGNSSRENEVRFAPWLGDHFGAAEIVSPAGPGSQLALAGATLRDGRLIAVWAGFDGQDDEIWYSVRPAGLDGRWSPPMRAADDNSTPDIVPAVAARGNGALLFWSRFDGSEYRMMAARFSGDQVTGARYVAPPGSLYPTVERGPRGLNLLYRDARTDAWQLAEIEDDGTLGRSARIESGSDDRPVVSYDGDAVLWDFGDRTALSSFQ